MTDTEALKALIKSKGLKYTFIAHELNLSLQGFYYKLTNVREFKPSEIVKLCELLDITSLKDKEQLFFKKKVD